MYYVNQKKCIFALETNLQVAQMFSMFDDLRNLNNESYGYGHKEITWRGASRCGPSEG